MESQFSQTIQDGGALIRLENQTQMQISLQRPRSEKAILADALGELELYPSAALAAVYNKPVGKDDSGRQVYATGLSIRAAESLASRWCNSAYGAEIISEEKDSILIGAVFLDMERNTRHSVSRRVSKSYKARGGGLVQLTGDRLDMAVNANISKALREVILRSLPAGLKAEYVTKAQEIIAKTSPEAIKKAIPKILAYFKKHEITQEIIEKFLGKPIKDMIGEDYVELQGVYNSVESGEMTAKEAFGIAAPDQPGESMVEKLKKQKAKSADTIDPQHAAALTEVKSIEPPTLAQIKGKLRIVSLNETLTMEECLAILAEAGK